MEFVLFFLFELILLFFLSRFLTQLLSQFFYRITKSQRVTIQLLALLFLPGVVVHELAHFFMASVLLVSTGEIEFLPQLTKDGVKLGSVEVGKTDPIRRALIGFAPVFVGITLIAGFLFYAFSGFNGQTTVEIWKLALLLYILFEIGNTMFSSKKDLEGALELLLVFVIVFTVLYLVGFRLPNILLLYVNSPLISSFMQQVSLFFIIPLLIDVVICGTLYLLVRKS